MGRSCIPVREYYFVGQFYIRVPMNRRSFYLTPTVACKFTTRPLGYLKSEYLNLIMKCVRVHAARTQRWTPAEHFSTTENTRWRSNIQHPVPITFGPASLFYRPLNTEKHTHLHRLHYNTISILWPFYRSYV